LILSVPKETLPGEKRVALSPDTTSKLIKLGFEVHIEKGAGINAGFDDNAYKSAGAKIIDAAGSLYGNSTIILKVQKPTEEELKLFKKGSFLISFFFPLSNLDLAKNAAAQGINILAMDAVPRITRAQSMDALSSQANLAGYKSVLMCANELGKIFPLMMTAAGTITPAKVIIMGAGVAGLQALGTAKRLGAVVEVSDIRPAVKEEVLSLGGKFIEVDSSENMQDSGGYAKEASEEFLQKQKDLLFKHITEADVVITTALVPGKKAPVLVTKEMVENMKPGSVILDMAVEFGGNCELSENNKTIEVNGVKIIGEPNIPSLVPKDASEVYSKNILNLIKLITKDNEMNLDMDDEIVKSIMITKDGEIIHKPTLELIK
jgi:H+-translocating NAD(P) transhydrogenase subunit alpha